MKQGGGQYKNLKSGGGGGGRGNTPHPLSSAYDIISPIVCWAICHVGAKIINYAWPQFFAVTDL